MSKYRRRYRPGPKITSLNELVEQDFVYWRDKITPRGWFMSWQIQMAKRAIDLGRLRAAIKREDENV